MRRLLGTILCLLLPVFVTAQTSFLGDVETLRAQYPTPMSPAQLGELLNRLAWQHRAEGWGLLRKDAGSTCPLNGRTIACDILFHAPSATHWDVLSDQEDTATPTFNPKGPMELSRFLPPIDPGGTPAPSPTPPPPAVDEVIALLRQSRAEDAAQQERIYADLKASIADSTAQVLAEARASHAALREQLRLHDEEPAWVTKILSNRYVQLALVGVGTWLSSWQVAK